jgi:hypothetical protein
MDLIVLTSALSKVATARNLVTRRLPAGERKTMRELIELMGCRTSYYLTSQCECEQFGSRMKNPDGLMMI